VRNPWLPEIAPLQQATAFMDRPRGTI